MKKKWERESRDVDHGIRFCSRKDGFEQLVKYWSSNVEFLDGILMYNVVVDGGSWVACEPWKDDNDAVESRMIKIG